ncbi:MAG: oligoendopeptidase F [Rhodospirillaceae bacterium]|nr:oligoendopeptidase F [Rhodospirillaceae bacterium]
MRNILKKLFAPASASLSSKVLGDLPEWNLDDLFPGIDSDFLKNLLERTDAQAKLLNTKYSGKIGNISASDLAKVIVEYEEIDESLARIMSYASLVYAADMSDQESGRFYQSMQEQVTDIATQLLFLTLEINKIDDPTMKRNLADNALAKFEPWLRDVRALRPHQLSDDIERLLLEKQVVGKSAWIRLFDETMADLRFEVELITGTKTYTSAEVFNLLSDKNNSIRKAAAISIGKVLADNARVFTLITNTLAKDKEVEDKWRHFKEPVSSRNLSNFVEDDVVHALVTSVKERFPDLSHRYYALKARWFGSDHLNYWDRNAPLPDNNEPIIPWHDAVDTVLESYRRFSPKLADIGKDFFDNDWIDAPVRDGKSPGAFAHPTVPSVHPYLLLNYQGKTRDVMTLAHELGHGVHQVLAGSQGHLMSDTPLTLAETASVFGEMLTFRKMLDDTSDVLKRRVMLASKIEDMINTVVRQIAFFEFERRVHTQRSKGALLTEEICDIWMEVQSESLGPAILLEDGYRHYWSYIPHFIHSPFYVYAYAFGDCLVNSLYAAYQEKPQGFELKYLDMLRAGGSLRHKQLLAPFGIDASEPAFWHQGLSVISSLIDELVQMDIEK